MINKNKLRAAMMAAGYPTVEQAAKAIGMPAVTMYRRMSKGIFDNNEIEAMVLEYHITDIIDVFFPGIKKEEK